MNALTQVDDELSSQMASVCSLLNSMHAEGLLGRADRNTREDEKDDEAIALTRTFKDLESRISALPPYDDRRNGWLSLIRNAYHSVVPEKRAQRIRLISEGIWKLNSQTIKTSARRAKFKILYGSLYRKNLPFPEPGVLGRPFPCKPTLSTYNMATMGFLSWSTRPAFTWSTSGPSVGMLGKYTIRIQELTLRSLTRRMVNVLETAYNYVTKDSKENQMVDKVGTYLQDTIISSRRYAGVRISLECLIEQASACIEILEHDFQSSKPPTTHQKIGLSKSSMNELGRKVPAWLGSLTTFCGLQAAVQPPATRAITSGSSDDRLASFGSALAEEAWLWNATDAQLSAWESGHRIIPLNWLCRDGLRVVSDQLSYTNICKKMEINLGVKSLFEYPPPYHVHQYEGGRGGFSCVKKVTLQNPIEYRNSAPIRRLMGRGTTNIICEVAVKVIRLGESEQATCLRIAKEARAWVELLHDHINPLLGFWENFEGSIIPCFVSPWANQGTLPAYLKKTQNATTLQRVQIMRDVADALAFMHNREFSVVHGDLRGSNILIHDNRALVCDFGVSHITDGLSGTTTAVHGDWRWMAPEYFYFEADEVDEKIHVFKPTPQTDVYSYASVCVEAFTGRIPWLGAKMMCRARFPSAIEAQPKEVCDEYWEFLTECWSHDPLLRPTAREVFEKMQMFIKRADIEIID